MVTVLEAIQYVRYGCCEPTKDRFSRKCWLNLGETGGCKSSKNRTVEGAVLTAERGIVSAGNDLPE